MITYKVENNTVYEITKLPSGTTIKASIDSVYHIRLSYDPARGKVRAEVFDWQDNPVPTFTDPITFVLDGQTITVTPIEGIAEIDFTTDLPGEYTIRTVNPGIRNGEVTIRV